MTVRGRIHDEKRRTARIFAFIILTMAVLAGSYAQAADGPDLIFRRSTVFKLLTPNDKLATYGVDDPEIEGVACHFTVPEVSTKVMYKYAFFGQAPDDRLPGLECLYPTVSARSARHQGLAGSGGGSLGYFAGLSPDGTDSLQGKDETGRRHVPAVRPANRSRLNHSRAAIARALETRPA